MMHGIDYHGQRVAGWLACEKLDGWRAFWTGCDLVTRQGNSYSAPAWFTADLPAGVALDCELVTLSGRTSHDLVNGLVRRGAWERLRLVVFDAPEVAGGFAKRIEQARRLVANVVEVFTVRGIKDARERMQAIVARGGEGLMLHEPRARYVDWRTDSLLKLKPAGLLGAGGA